MMGGGFGYGFPTNSREVCVNKVFELAKAFE
jgi:hypothetical protein